MVTVETTAIEVAYLSFIVALITLVASNIVQIWLSHQETKRHREQLKNSLEIEHIRAEENRTQLLQEKWLSEKLKWIGQLHAAYSDLLTIAFQNNPISDVYSFYTKLNYLLSLLPSGSNAYNTCLSLSTTVESCIFPDTSDPVIPCSLISSDLQRLGNGISELSALPLDP